MARARINKSGYSVVFNTAQGQAIDLSPAMLRDIYDNRDKNFLLGSFMAAPVVDLLNSYVGSPQMICEDPNAQEEIDRALELNANALTEVQRMAFRDASAWLRVAWEPADDGVLYAPGESGRLTLIPIPCDKVKANRHPATGEVTWAQITDTYSYIDPKSDTEKTCEIITEITPTEERIFVSNGEAPEGLSLEPIPNKLGAVPLVEFVNDPDPASGAGVSEIARIAPLIAIYHDILFHAVKGSKMHSVPKLLFKVASVQGFMKDNLGTDAATGARKLSLSGLDAMFVKPGSSGDSPEDAKYIEASNVIGASIDLLKKVFYCMVITSETPEYALGVHMSSSYASTSEQTPVWGMKVARKQLLFGSYWTKVARLMMAKLALGKGSRFVTYASRVVWNAPDAISMEAIATARDTTVRAITAAVREKLMSRKAGVQTLTDLFPAMLQFDDEKEAIAEGAKELAALEQPANTGDLVNMDKLIAEAEKVARGGA